MPHAVTPDDIIRLARFAVGLAKLSVSTHDREDIVSELQLAALKSLKRFPNMRRDQFTTYFLAWAVKEARALAGGVNAWRDGQTILFSEMDRPASTHDCKPTTAPKQPDTAVVDAEDEAAMVGDVIADIISERDAEILTAVYVLGETQAEVAVRFHISQQAISLICERSIVILQKHIP
jgi:RNA polymerase sigma factor (sigma-70 family)